MAYRRFHRIHLQTKKRKLGKRLKRTGYNDRYPRSALCYLPPGNGGTERLKKTFIRPKEDFCMKELFRNEAVRKHFLSDALEIPITQIKSTRLTNSFLWKRRQEEKQGILDVLIELNNDTMINVEIQLKAMKNWDRRQIFYVAKVYVSGFHAGQDYNRIKRTVGISLLDFNLTDREEYHSIYRLRDANGNELSDSMEIHIIELRKKLSGKDPMDEWIQFFNITSKEELEKMKSNTKNSGIIEAIKELKSMNISQMIRWELDARMIAKMDQRAREDYVRDEGLETGRSEGEARFANLTQHLLSDGRSADLLKASQDIEYRKLLYQEYQI